MRFLSPNIVRDAVGFITQNGNLMASSERQSGVVNELPETPNPTVPGQAQAGESIQAAGRRYAALVGNPTKANDPQTGTLNPMMFESRLRQIVSEYWNRIRAIGRR